MLQNSESRPKAAMLRSSTCREEIWWSQAGSNRRPLECHSSALPAELWPHSVRGVGMNRGKGRRRSSARLYSRLVGADSSLFVVLDVAVDQIGDVVLAFLLLLEEGVVVGHVLGDVDILVDRQILLGLARLDLLEATTSSGPAGSISVSSSSATDGGAGGRPGARPG